MSDTDDRSRAGAALGIRRQCSIGWHYECSDPEGLECACECHPERNWRRSLPLPTEAGLYVDRFGDPWRLEDDGGWWFGNDDEADPHENAPFVRLERVS